MARKTTSLSGAAVVCVLAMTLTLTTPVQATCGGTVTTINGEIYIDDAGNGDVRIYLESNGLDGFQVGFTNSFLAQGGAPVNWHFDCDGHEHPDTLLFMSGVPA